jgi:tRNA(adenine34) deaminase
MSDYLVNEARSLREDDERWMRAALAEASRSLESNDVPVGAVVVRDAQMLAAAGNGRERLSDPTAHAEVLALRAAAAATGTWRLDGTSLYVTLEPCAMCAGAIVLARVDRVVFGAPDPKAGFGGSLGNLLKEPRLNHRVALTAGVLADECGDVLRDFFRSRRA